jgi:hypothetical protein
MLLRLSLFRILSSPLYFRHLQCSVVRNLCQIQKVGNCFAEDQDLAKTRTRASSWCECSWAVGGLLCSRLTAAVADLFCRHEVMNNASQQIWCGGLATGNWWSQRGDRHCWLPWKHPRVAINWVFCFSYATRAGKFGYWLWYTVYFPIEQLCYRTTHVVWVYRNIFYETGLFSWNSAWLSCLWRSHFPDTLRWKL